MMVTAGDNQCRLTFHTAFSVRRLAGWFPVRKCRAGCGAATAALSDNGVCSSPWGERPCAQKGTGSAHYSPHVAKDHAGKLLMMYDSHP
jgi:hypothetical protein